MRDILVCPSLCLTAGQAVTHRQYLQVVMISEASQFFPSYNFQLAYNENFGTAPSIILYNSKHWLRRHWTLIICQALSWLWGHKNEKALWWMLWYGDRIRQKSHRHAETITDRHMGRPDSSSPSPSFSSSSPLSPLLLASVSCASPFKDVFKDGSHYMSLNS